MLSWHGAITIQTRDEIPGFFEKRGPKLVRAEVSGLNRGPSISRDLCCPHIPVSEATIWIGNPWQLELGMTRKACTFSCVRKGWGPGKGQQGYRRKFGNPSSLTHTHTLLGFPGCLEHLLLQEMHDGAEMFDINIVSSAQFVYRELKLYLKISLIQERTFPLLSWDTVAVESPLTKFIPTDVNSHTLKIKALWRHKCQSNPQARP